MLQLVVVYPLHFLWANMLMISVVRCPFPDILSRGSVSCVRISQAGFVTHPGDLEDGVSALAEEGGGELDPAPPSVDVRLQVQFLRATEYLLPR